VRNWCKEIGSHVLFLRLSYGGFVHSFISRDRSCCRRRGLASAIVFPQLSLACLPSQRDKAIMNQSPEPSPNGNEMIVGNLLKTAKARGKRLDRMAGLFGGRRARPPAVRAARVSSKRNDVPGLGSRPASIWWPGASRHRFGHHRFAPEPPIPEPGYWNQTSHGDDYKNIHSNTFSLRERHATALGSPYC